MDVLKLVVGWFFIALVAFSMGAMILSGLQQGHQRRAPWMRPERARESGRAKPTPTPVPTRLSA